MRITDREMASGPHGPALWELTFAALLLPHPDTKIYTLKKKKKIHLT